jgi:dihydroneopterin aldolase
MLNYEKIAKSIEIHVKKEEYQEQEKYRKRIVDGICLLIQSFF